MSSLNKSDSPNRDSPGTLSTKKSPMVLYFVIVVFVISLAAFILAMIAFVEDKTSTGKIYLIYLKNKK